MRPAPVNTLPDGTPVFAPLGELLVVVDDGRRVVCHLCGRALAWLGRRICARTAGPRVLYREAFGLRRGALLRAPAVAEHRRQLGVRRCAENTRLREGLKLGQAMARSGELLELSHAAQPVGSADGDPAARRCAQ